MAWDRECIRSEFSGIYDGRRLAMRSEIRSGDGQGSIKSGVHGLK